MEQLLRPIRYESDQKVFRDLFTSNAPCLLGFAFIYVKNKFVAEEIVDDVFLLLWKNKETITEIKDMKAYLYTGVKNRIYNYFNRNRDRKNINVDMVADASLNMAIDPEQIFIAMELRQLLEKTINTLPERCKLIFKMIKEDGLKQKEVASVLNISQKTVENQLNIAVKKIKKEITLSYAEGRANSHYAGI